MFSKSPPLRSKKLLRFAHDELRDTVCCICQEAPWTELHHFGDDGGRGLKPSDNEVARVCKACHMTLDHKRRALVRRGEHEVLEAFQNDALKINRAYIEQLEAKR